MFMMMHFVYLHLSRWSEKLSIIQYIIQLYKVVAHGTVCTTVCHGCIAPYKVHTGHKLSYNTYIIRTGGKNQAIDALLSLGNVGDNVPQAETAAADALFELFGATPQDGVLAWGTDTVAT
jgi:hypothetical protein